MIDLSLASNLWQIRYIIMLFVTVLIYNDLMPLCSPDLITTVNIYFLLHALCYMQEGREINCVLKHIYRLQLNL